jgi:Cu+-exporting ATPase
VRRTLIILAVSACVSSQPWGGAIEVPTAGARPITISVTSDGFVPKQIDVSRGETVSLVFTREVEHTCAKQVIVELDAHREVRRDLPLHQPVAIALRFDRAGELGFTCGMKMLGGTITVH